MSAYFQNSLVFGANASDVCNAIKQWHVSEGLEPVTHRLLFDCFNARDEVRAYVISNEKWSVVLHSHDEGPGMRRALSRFPVLLQLWARNGGWGWRFDENGSQITTFCSKRGLELLGDAPARQPGDLARLASACDVTDALPKLERIQSTRYFFNDKPCSEFADALKVPVATLKFRDVDVANAGMREERFVAGWKCQTLCFRKVRVESKEANRYGDLAKRLNDPKSRKKAKWIMFLMAPILGLAGLIAIPLGMAVMAILALVTWLHSFPRIRKAFLGESVTVREEFVDQLKALEPKRIIIQGDIITNTRHNCSLTVCSPAKPYTKPLRSKGPPDEIVFAIEVENQFLTCTAYPPIGLPRWGGVEVLDRYPFQVGEIEGQFEKHGTRNTKRKWVHYLWTLPAPNAAYRFFISRETDLTAGQLEFLEKMIRTFTVKQVPG